MSIKAVRAVENEFENVKKTVVTRSFYDRSSRCTVGHGLAVEDEDVYSKVPPIDCLDVLGITHHDVVLNEHYCDSTVTASEVVEGVEIVEVYVDVTTSFIASGLY